MIRYLLLGIANENDAARRINQRFLFTFLSIMSYQKYGCCTPLKWSESHRLGGLSHSPEAV